MPAREKKRKTQLGYRKIQKKVKKNMKNKLLIGGCVTASALAVLVLIGGYSYATTGTVPEHAIDMFLTVLSVTGCICEHA